MAAQASKPTPEQPVPTFHLKVGVCIECGAKYAPWQMRCSCGRELKQPGRN